MRRPFNTRQPLYWTVRKKYRKWRGTRFFRIDWQAQEVVQVLVTPGEEKKGRGNTFGIYTISLVTLFGNFMGPGYLQSVTKAQFEEQFNEVVKFLKS